MVQVYHVSAMESKRREVSRLHCLLKQKHLKKEEALIVQERKVC
jgi:hypothetical protein